MSLIPTDGSGCLNQILIMSVRLGRCTINAIEQKSTKLDVVELSAVS